MVQDDGTKPVHKYIIAPHVRCSPSHHGACSGSGCKARAFPLTLIPMKRRQSERPWNAVSTLGLCLTYACCWPFIEVDEVTKKVESIKVLGPKSTPSRSLSWSIGCFQNDPAIPTRANKKKPNINSKKESRELLRLHLVQRNPQN